MLRLFIGELPLDELRECGGECWSLLTCLLIPGDLACTALEEDASLALLANGLSAAATEPNGRKQVACILSVIHFPGFKSIMMLPSEQRSITTQGSQACND